MSPTPAAHEKPAIDEEEAPPVEAFRTTHATCMSTGKPMAEAAEKEVRQLRHSLENGAGKEFDDKIDGLRSKVKSGRRLRLRKKKKSD
jgi:hypothetical protein